MKALSVRSPWWWYIVHGIKDVENRSRVTHYRGPVLIHASQYWGREVEYAYERAEDICRATLDISWGTGLPDKLPKFKKMRGLIVGKVDIVDCIQTSKSPWYEGPEINDKPNYAWVLANATFINKPTRFIKGKLGLFEV